MPTRYSISHLDQLEAEALYIIRECAAQFRNPVILFSGGKDSIVLTHLACKAFWPTRLPLPLMHVDTGHNFPETLAYRNAMAERIGAKLIIASVQESIDKGRVREEKGANASRNRLQTTTLLDAISQWAFDAALGGARRDEEKARAKERIFSHRDEFGQWDPKNQRPELWSLYNGRMNPGEHFRAFPLSNWTELDIWQYIKRESIELPCLYYAHKREVIERNGTLLAVCEFVTPREGETVMEKSVRFRTMGDAPITGAVESQASTVDDIIAETAAARITERGGRADDRRSDTAMEDRKKEGYF